MSFFTEPPPVGGYLYKAYCSSQHPTVEHVWCRKGKNHDGDCSAYVFLISAPDTWERP